MEFSDVIRARHSVRAFTDQPVSDDQLQALLAAATTAPSWSNTQPYQIAIARGKVLESLREELPPRFDKLAALQKAPMTKKVLAWLRKDGIPEWPFGFEGNEADRLKGAEISAVMYGHEFKGKGQQYGSFQLSHNKKGDWIYTNPYRGGGGRRRRGAPVRGGCPRPFP